jgi:hypothetical protein
MTYDPWKASNPNDEWLGPEPETESPRLDSTLAARDALEAKAAVLRQKLHLFSGQAISRVPAGMSAAGLPRESAKRRVVLAHRSENILSKTGKTFIRAVAFALARKV